MTNPVSEFIVRSNGSIDQAATLAKFSAALGEYVTKRETEDDDISRAVNTVFDRHPGASINLPALSSMACGVLNTSASAYTEMSERVANFVRANSGEGGAYQIKKGKGGGVRRTADLPPAETK